MILCCDYRVRNEFPAGAVVFRDARVWHRGVPNESDEPRPNMVRKIWPIFLAFYAHSRPFWCRY